MTEGRGDVLGPLRTLFSVGSFAGWTDGELLERYARSCDEVGERAFAALVERHGSGVLRVCRGVLGDPHDADDAFQATFLVLAERARSIRDREAVGPWLLGVAYRVAGCARASARRRRAHERRAAEAAIPFVVDEEPSDWGPLLREEVGRLPEKFQVPLVLCYLEGLTQEEVASRLGWPIGTVRSRLARGRKRLRRRLVLRGVAPSVAAVAVGSWREAGAVSVCDVLVEQTARAAMHPGATIGTVSTTVATLTEEVLRTMIWTKLKTNAAALLMAGLLVTGAGVVAGQAGALPGQVPAGGVKPNATVAKAGSSKARIEDPDLFIVVVDRSKAADLGQASEDVRKDVVAAFNSIPFNKRNFWIDPVGVNQFLLGMPYHEWDIKTVLEIPITPRRPDGPTQPIPLKSLAALSRTTRRQLEDAVKSRELDLQKTHAELLQAEANVRLSQAALSVAKDRLKALRGRSELPVSKKGHSAVSDPERRPRAVDEK